VLNRLLALLSALAPTLRSWGQALSNRSVSLLRTAVPTLWGALIAWALTRLHLPSSVAVFLQAQTGAVTAVAIMAWYAAWRWVEHRLPPWLTRVVLGSNKTPDYRS